MEKLNNYNIRSYDVTRWFFRIVLLMLVTFAALLYLLNINETIRIQDGEIVSTNPQSDYKAPFEGQLVKINVKEGQSVSKGDTLLVIQNIEYSTQLQQKKTEMDFLQKSILLIAAQQNDLRAKRNALLEESILNTNRHQIEISRLTNEFNNLNDQTALQREHLASANEKFSADSILYRKDMLSRAEYNESRDANLSARSNLSAKENEKRKNINDRSLSNNIFLRDQNSYSVRKVELDEQDQTLQQSKNQLENQLAQADAAFKQIQTDVNKQNVIATTDGIVNYIFNTAKTSNLLAKGDLLISIAPRNLNYYAKAVIAQKDIPYIRSGLAARLKLDAYYHFEHGVIKGKVSYLAERKENEKFYALIQLPVNNNIQLKSGYTVQGEIIIRRMPLYRYFIKLLFKRFDK